MTFSKLIKVSFFLCRRKTAARTCWLELKSWRETWPKVTWPYRRCSSPVTHMRSRATQRYGATHLVRYAARFTSSPNKQTVFWFHLFCEVAVPTGQEAGKKNFQKTCQATRPPLYNTRRRLHNVPFHAERQAGKLGLSISIVFGLTWWLIEF